MSNGYVYVGPVSYNAQAIGNNAIRYAQQNPTTAEYAAYAGARLGNQMESDAGQEETLGRSLLFGSAFMSIPHIGKAFHPIRTYKAISSANEAFKAVNTDTFKTLSKAEQGTAYSNLFNLARNGAKLDTQALLKMGRSEADVRTIEQALKSASENYKAALQAGDKVAAAQYSAEMNTILSSSKKHGLISRGFKKLFHWKEAAPKFTDAATVAKNAKEAGEAAKVAATATKTAAETAKATGKIAQGVNWTKNALKSGGFKGMAIFSGIIECFTEVLPAFNKGGAKEGTKQIAKSAVTVTTDAAGWAIGAKAGASIGAAIGSVFPGAGTAIGGAIGGIIGGIAGAFCARKVTKAVVGKSFSEKQSEKEKSQALAQEQAQVAQPVQQAQVAQQPTQAVTTNPFATLNPGIDTLEYDFTSPIGIY